jgi:hypothetical protein
MCAQTSRLTFSGSDSEQEKRGQERVGPLRASFLPPAQTSISQTIRQWTLHHRSDRALHELAKMYNPYIQGWINYHGNFYRTQLRPTLQRIDLYVIRWARARKPSSTLHIVSCTAHQSSSLAYPQDLSRPWLKVLFDHGRVMSAKRCHDRAFEQAMDRSAQAREWNRALKLRK